MLFLTHSLFLSFPPTVPPSPPNFSPVKLEHAEQLELGYMPFRDDFEIEHDNDAETLVSSMAVGAEDEELEKALKLAHVDMYIRRLKERDRRKRSVNFPGESLSPPLSSYCVRVCACLSVCVCVC